MLRNSAADPGLAATHQFVRPLGIGSSGQIAQFVDKATQEHVAIKFVRRPVPRVVAWSLLQEILIQAELGEQHVSIVSAKEVMLTNAHLCLVMEVATGGTLSHHLGERAARRLPDHLHTTEDEAHYYFKQIVQALQFCHSNLVCHRDIKLDNALLDGSNPPRIKLCDFGFAKAFEKGTSARMFTMIGTPAYMSPSQLHLRSGGDGYLGTAGDVWASGMLLVVLLLGEFPFDVKGHPNPEGPAAKKELWARQHASAWHHSVTGRQPLAKLSPQCRDLIDQMLNVDESQRISLPQVCEHPWFLQPPAPRFSAAVAQMTVEQEHLDSLAGLRASHQAAGVQRAAQVENLIALAGLRPPQTANDPTSPQVRIDLRHTTLPPARQGSSDGTEACVATAATTATTDAKDHSVHHVQPV